MSQTIKPNKAPWIIGIVLAIGICCIGIPASILYWLETEFGYGPSYTLTVDGDRLFVKEDQSGREFVLAEGKTSGIQFDFDFVSKELLVKDYLSENRQKLDYAYDFHWSPSHHAAFFLNQKYEKDGTLTEIWKWSPEKSFEKLHTYFLDISLLHESVDGKFLTAGYYDFQSDGSQKSGVVVYELSNHNSTTYESSDQMLDAIMIGPDRFFVAGNPGRIWNVKENKTSLCSAKGQLDQLVLYRGEIWALWYENETYKVVKMSKDMMSFEKIVDFPADFPKATEASQAGD